MRRLADCLVLAWLALPAAAAAAADWAPAQKIDAYFDSLARHQLANASIAISTDGVVRYQRSVGFARLEPGGPVAATALTRYRIGSVSKLYTATLVMQLVEQGKLSLDEALSGYLPGLPNARSLSVRHLLQHRSGLPNYSDDAEFESWRTRPRSPEAMLATIARPGIRFKPGEKVEYSNSNYLLLGYLLERKYATPYDDILRRQILAKLNLSNTYHLRARTEDRESISYVFTPEGWSSQAPTDASIHGGAGALVATPADMVLFMDALFAGRVVSPRYLTAMRDQEGGSGMGLWPYDLAQHRGFGHGGRVEGYRACLYHFPDEGLSIAFATNASVLSMDEIVDQVLSLIFDLDDRAPTFEPVELSAQSFATLSGTWRSAAGRPLDSPFRQFADPDQPLELLIRTSGDQLRATLNGGDFRLIPLGDDEFLVEGIRYFLRAYPLRGELVVRGPEWAYYFRRSE